MQGSNLILISNFVSTWFMVGLIWIIQVVHYPLFKLVGNETYEAYQASHQSLITLIVGPVMLIELITGFLLLQKSLPNIRKWSVVLAFVLLIVVWLSTALIQVPCHEQLTRGFNADVHAWLVNSNWIRTVAWTGRGLLVAWMILSIMPNHGKNKSA